MRAEIERIAERVRDHDSPRPRRQRGVQLHGIDVVRRHVHVEKHRDQPILNDRIDGRRKAGRDGDDFIAGPKLAVAELGRRQARQRDEIRGGAGVDKQRVPQAPPLGERPFELGGESSGGEPKVERAIDEMDHVIIVKNAAGARNRRGGGIERLRRECRAMIFANQIQDLRPELLR